MTVQILRQAGQDLVAGYRFYQDQEPGLGEYFLDSLMADIDSLRYFAGIHAVHAGYHRMLAGRFPFALYYRVDGDTVKLYAVLDCRRNPSWTRDRLG